jgi:ankyrin repeat protein
MTQYVFMQDDIGDIALINSCQGGHVETARVLLDHGAATDHRNKVYFYAFT